MSDSAPHFTVTTIGFPVTPKHDMEHHHLHPFQSNGIFLFSFPWTPTCCLNGLQSSLPRLSSGSYRDTRTSIWSTWSPGWSNYSTILLVFLLSPHSHYQTETVYKVGIRWCWHTLFSTVSYVTYSVRSSTLHWTWYSQSFPSIARGKGNNKVELRTFFHLPSCVCSYFSRNVALWTL